MAVTYWAVGRRIVEFELEGKDRAAYGTRLISRLASDLTRRFGRGFGAVNLAQMRRFYQTWPKPEILQTASEKSGRPAAASTLPRFLLSWSHAWRQRTKKGGNFSALFRSIASYRAFKPAQYPLHTPPGWFTGWGSFGFIELK